MVQHQQWGYLKDRGPVKSGGRSEGRWSWTALTNDGTGCHLSADDGVSRSLRGDTKHGRLCNTQFYQTRTLHLNKQINNYVSLAQMKINNTMQEHTSTLLSLQIDMSSNISNTLLNRCFPEL